MSAKNGFPPARRTGGTRVGRPETVRWNLARRPTKRSTSVSHRHPKIEFFSESVFALLSAECPSRPSCFRNFRGVGAFFQGGHETANRFVFWNSDIAYRTRAPLRHEFGDFLKINHFQLDVQYDYNTRFKYAAVCIRISKYEHTSWCSCEFWETVRATNQYGNPKDFEEYRSRDGLT